MLGGEIYPFAYAVHLSYVLRKYLGVSLSFDVPVMFLTDSLSLFNVVIRSSTVTTEKRLLIDIPAIRQANERQEIS